MPLSPGSNLLHYRITGTAWRQRDTMLRDLKASPQWDRLRGLPRFRAIMDAMAFPDVPA